MTPSVLIVDDSLTVRMDLVERFTAGGFQAHSCATAAEARATLASETFDVVVLDVRLPDGDGIELLGELRAGGRPSVTIFVLSSEAEVQDRIRELRTGADEYVGKPYDAAFLVGRAWDHVRAGRGRSPGQRSATVLVIDDSITVREGLRELLSAAGYDVLLASTGEDGLRTAGATRPDAVLVDSHLPGIDGAAVIRRLRQDGKLRHVPCMMLTGSGGESQLLALDSGADSYVEKTEGYDIVLVRLAALLRSAKAATSDDRPSVLAAKRILVVDDSATFRHQVAVPLRAEGYDLVLAASGEEALALLAVQTIDCVLMDMVMPGISGHDACRRIKAEPRLRDMPVIMITAHDDRQALIDGINAGADDYISKSAELDVLQARVRAQLRRKQFEDENRRIREELLRKELEATEARAARELAAVLEVKNRELAEQNRRVEAATRLKSEFLANMSHELRTPLNAIIGFTELIHDEQVGPLTVQQKEFLGDVLASSRHLLQLINDVLDLAKVEAGKMQFRPEVVDLARPVNEVRDIARSLSALKRIALTVVVDPSLTSLFIDPSKLKQVLYNFISNAIKFTPEGGSVTIRGLPEGPERFRLEVEDTGIGIAPADQEKLFVEFQQLDASAAKRYQGTGLGLALTKRLVEAQGGAIGMRPSQGPGSTFFAVLPRVCRIEREGEPEVTT